ASKIPKLPRTAVLPLRNGSQAKPMRGSKFLVVGLCVQKEDRKTEVGSPGTEAAKLGWGHAPGVTGPHGRGVDGVGMIAILPLISVATVVLPPATGSSPWNVNVPVPLNPASGVYPSNWYARREKPSFNACVPCVKKASS